MGSKQTKIEALLRDLGVNGGDYHYAGYFECFNRQLFYEAHEVLEGIWLPRRLQPDGNFYKGLIQLAGAFVHLQNGKAEPAARLFRMAGENLASYPPVHHRLDLQAVRGLIQEWFGRAGRGEPYRPESAPRIQLLKA